jgi:hypothetical protein
VQKYLLKGEIELPKYRALRDGSIDWQDLYKRAKVDPRERPGGFRLTEAWKGHRPGAIVIFDREFIYVFDRN